MGYGEFCQLVPGIKDERIVKAFKELDGKSTGYITRTDFAVCDYC